MRGMRDLFRAGSSFRLTERPSVLARVLAPLLGQQIIVPQDAETFADISFYQAGMDWGKYPHRAVILRIGQNLWKDTSFDSHYAAARAKGLAIGGYWFYDDRVSPDAQAATLLAAMNGKRFEMELFVDFERNFGGAYFGLRHIKRFVELIEPAVQCKAVGIYTGYYWWLANTANETALYPFFAARPLWLAWYSDASIVRVPSPWTTWTHWQYGTPAVQWGQQTVEIDANRHNGTRADFEARYLGGAKPPAQGGAMKEGTLDTSKASSLKIRTGPGTTYPQIGGILPGDTVYGELDTATNWLHIQWIVRAGGVREDIDGWCSAAYLILKDYVIPDAGEIVVNATLRADGTVSGTWTRK